MGDTRRETGRVAEEAAAGYLQGLGFAILERNYRRRRGEIDIIARKEDCIHFIEVKSIRSSSEIVPAESWDAEQRERFVKLAEEYLAEHHGEFGDIVADVSLDFIGIRLGVDDAVLDIELIEDAFRPG
jgi:putative endonuclease